MVQWVFIDNWSKCPPVTPQFGDKKKQFGTTNEIRIDSRQFGQLCSIILTDWKCYCLLVILFVDKVSLFFPIGISEYD